jgi:hypothetical protein
MAKPGEEKGIFFTQFFKLLENKGPTSGGGGGHSKFNTYLTVTPSAAGRTLTSPFLVIVMSTSWSSTPSAWKTVAGLRCCKRHPRDTNCCPPEWEANG